MIREWMRDMETDLFKIRQRRRLKARQRVKPLLRKSTWTANDQFINMAKVMNTTDNDNKIFLGVSDTEDLITAEIMTRRAKTGKTTVQRETTVLGNRSHWAEWAEEHYKDYLYIQSNASSGLIIEENTENFIKFDVNSNSTTIRAFGDVKFAEEQIAIIESNFSVVTSYVEWVYGTD